MPLPTIPSGNVASALPTGYEVANSCRFNRGDSPYMHITPSGDGNLKTFTVSFWVKRGNANAGSSGTDRQVIFSNATNDQISFHNDNLCFLEDGSDSAITNMKFLDFFSWYHIVMAFDTSQSTNTNRQKVYVNGKQIDQSTGFSTMSYVGQNLEMGFGKGSEMMSVGRSEYDDNRHFDGYLAEFYYINGSMLDHTSFGEFDEDSPTIWKPKKFEGSFGTNGFYLDFEDSSNLGNDANGGTDLTEVNLAAADQAVDTPTNNFCVWNALDNFHQQYTFSQGNCQVVTNSGDYGYSIATFGLTSGKWYWEIEYDAKSSGSDYAMIGFVDVPPINATTHLTGSATSYAYYTGGGWYYNNGGSGSVSTGFDTYTVGDIIGVALNLDDNEATFYKNGTAQNSGTAKAITAPASTTGGLYFPALSWWDTSTTATFKINFGGCSGFDVSSGNSDGNGYGNFEYAVPSGFYSLCTANLAEFG